VDSLIKNTGKRQYHEGKVNPNETGIAQQDRSEYNPETSLLLDHNGQFMMTKRPPLAVILLVIIVCFALGLLNVLLQEKEDPSSIPTPFLPSPSENTPSSIHNILVIGVDDLTRIDPKLRAIWIATHRSTENIIYLHGIPLDVTVPEEEGAHLKDVFEWSSQTGLSDIFLNHLYKIIPLEPHLTVILDDIAFARAIDYLGGVEIRGKNLDGASILTFLSLSWDQPAILIQDQADIIRAIIPKALGLPETPELTELLALIPDHASLSLEISEAVGLVLPLREATPDSIFIILSTGDVQ
jgi:hypothetical protein